MQAGTAFTRRRPLIGEWPRTEQSEGKFGKADPAAAAASASAESPEGSFVCTCANLWLPRACCSVLQFIAEVGWELSGSCCRADHETNGVFQYWGWFLLLTDGTLSFINGSFTSPSSMVESKAVFEVVFVGRRTRTWRTRVRKMTNRPR